MSEAGAIRARVELVSGRARFTELSAGGFLRPRPLQVDGATARLALVGTYATLLGGDHVHIELTVGAGVSLELVEPSGTVAYDAQGGFARWSATVRVEHGAYLLWRGAPFVVTDGADVHRDTQLQLADDARALVAETLVLGRTYETGAGRLRSTMRAERAGRALLVEDLDLRGEVRAQQPGVMGANRAMATVLLLGDRPHQVGGLHETRLATAGAMARRLAPAAHEAEGAVDPSWHRWQARLTVRPGDNGAGRPTGLACRGPAGPRPSTASAERADDRSQRFLE